MSKLYLAATQLTSYVSFLIRVHYFSPFSGLSTFFSHYLLVPPRYLSLQFCFVIQLEDLFFSGKVHLMDAHDCYFW